MFYHPIPHDAPYCFMKVDSIPSMNIHHYPYQIRVCIKEDSVKIVSSYCTCFSVWRSQIRLNAYPACTCKRSPAFVCSDVVFQTYITPGPNFLKMLTAHALYVKLANTHHIEILDILLTETMFVRAQNPCMLPLRSQIRQIRAKSGPGRFWDQHTGYALIAFFND